MRRIAVINQKGGVGKTTSSTNLAACLAEQGRRVVLVDMDPQANLSLHLGVETGPGEPSIYPVLLGRIPFGEAVRPTSSPRLRLVPSNLDLSGAELELASAIGRESLLRDALERWEAEELAATGEPPADYLIFDCPPSLGLLAINALAAAGEVVIAVQTEFMALMGLSKLVEVVQLIRRRLNPELEISGILACLYDSRLRLAREVLGELRKFFPELVFRQPIRANVKLAEAPSFGRTILEYAPESHGALDHRRVALEIIAQESRDPGLAQLPPPRPLAELPTALPQAAPGASAPPAAEREVVLEPAPRERSIPRPPSIPKLSAPARKPEARRTPPRPIPEAPLARRGELPSLPPEALEIQRPPRA